MDAIKEISAILVPLSVLVMGIIAKLYYNLFKFRVDSIEKEFGVMRSDIKDKRTLCHEEFEGLSDDVRELFNSRKDMCREISILQTKIDGMTARK